MKGVSVPKVDLKALVGSFRNLNPKDVGAWPLAPRIAALLGLALLILLAGWWFVWNDQLATLETRQQDEVKLKEDFVAKKKQAVNLDHALVSAAKLGTGAFLQLLFDAVYNAENLHGLCAAHGFFNLSAMIF